MAGAAPPLAADAAAAGLADFSHVWVVWAFHQNANAAAKPKVAPPRLGGRRVGLYATRTPHRPNAIGLSLARLEAVERDVVHLTGLDVVDGTPILDIKPYIPGYDAPGAGEGCAVPEWLGGGAPAPLPVEFAPSALAELRALAGTLRVLRSADEAERCIRGVLCNDPRSVYRKQSCLGEPYPFCLDTLHIVAQFDEGGACTVTKVEPLGDTPY